MEAEDEDAHRYGTQETTESYENAVGVETCDYADADNIITIEQPAADIDDDAVIGDDGGVLGLLATYSAILRQGVNAMFPCQQLYIYCETAEDLVTVGRGSALYRLMEDSGGRNVSSRLTVDMLTVTADWVVRRNPDAIVKFVDSTVLGSGVTSNLAASEVAQAMLARPDWGAIDAIRNSRVILLSQQMLDTEETRLAAQLLIAHMLYPELFAGIDVNGAVAELLRGVGGIHFYGVVS